MKTTPKHHHMVIPTRTGKASVATERRVVSDKFARWEALRSMANTIGAQDALTRVMHKRQRGKALFEYLWMLIATSLLILVLAKCHGPLAEADDRKLHPDAELVPIERVEWLEGRAL